MLEVDEAISGVGRLANTARETSAPDEAAAAAYQKAAHDANAAPPEHHSLLGDLWGDATSAVSSGAHMLDGTAHAAGHAMGGLAQDGINAATGAVRDVAGNDAANVFHTAADGALQSVKDQVGFAYGVAAGGADALGGMVKSTVDLAGDAFKFATDGSYRGQVVQGAEHFAAQVANNPLGTAEAVGKGLYSAGKAWVQGAETAAKHGDLGEYVGRGVGNLAVNVGSLFIPGADGAEVANLAAKGGEAAEMLGRAGSLTNDAGKLAELGGGAGKAAELGGDAGKLGDAAEHAGATGAEAPAEVGLHAAPEPLPAPEVSTGDIDSLRARMGVPDTNTVGVARTNVPGLQDEVFEGASAVPRREAGLPPAETGPIKSPNASPLFSNHAEQDIANQFVAAVDKAGLKPSDLDGKELLMRIQNEGGVCSICRQGLTNPKVPSGVLKQLSERYPGLNIHVVVDNPGPKLQGAADFVIRNGAYVK